MLQKSWDPSALVIELITGFVGKKWAYRIRLVSKDWNEGASATLQILRPNHSITDLQFSIICTRFSSIINLNLSGCKNLTDAALSQLIKLPNLIELNIEQCTGLGGAVGPGCDLSLSTLQTLKTIKLGSHLKALGCFSTLPNLHALGIGKCESPTESLSETLVAELTIFSMLKVLEFAPETLVTGSMLENIGKITSLEVLDLGYSRAPIQGQDLSENLVLMLSGLRNLNTLKLYQVFYLGEVSVRAFCEWPLPVEFRLDEVTLHSSLTLETVLRCLSPEAAGGFHLLAVRDLGWNGSQIVAEDFVAAGGLNALIQVMSFSIHDSSSLEYREACFESLAFLCDRSIAVQNELIRLDLAYKLMDILLEENDSNEGLLHYSVAKLALTLCTRDSEAGRDALKRAHVLVPAARILIRGQVMGKNQELALLFGRLRCLELCVFLDEPHRGWCILQDLIVQEFISKVHSSSDVDYICYALSSLAILAGVCDKFPKAFLNDGMIFATVSLLDIPVTDGCLSAWNVQCVHATVDLIYALGEAYNQLPLLVAFCKAGAISKLSGILEGKIESRSSLDQDLFRATANTLRVLIRVR